MLDIEGVRKGFESRLKTWAATKSLPVQYENVKFETPSTPYISCYLLLGSTVHSSMCYGNEDSVGVFQVNVNTLVNTGSKLEASLCKEIADLFPAGYTFSIDAGNDHIRVTQPAQLSSSSYVGSSHVTRIVTINYSTI